MKDEQDRQPERNERADGQNPERNPEEYESNAARRLRAQGESTSEAEEEEPLKINRLANFWYHNKVGILIAVFFAFVVGVAAVQFGRQQRADLSLLYAGPDYITPNQNQAFCAVLEGLMPDYNGDGRKQVQLNDMVFLTEKQVDRYMMYIEETGDDMLLDLLANKQMNERFTYEVFGGEASICILADDQYQSVAAAEGFLPLKELFGDAPEDIPEGAMDECGVRLRDTKLFRYFEAAQVFPDDAVLALRRISTMSALTGKKKAERAHEYSRDLFMRMLTFEYPEGWEPPADEE